MVRILTLAATLALQIAQQPAPDVPRTFQIDGQILVQAKAQRDPSLIKRAQHEADAEMHAGPFSVTDKTATPPSGDKHDYLSLAPYFWPNPATSNHLPYIRRDGQHNPQVNAISDHNEIASMAKAVHALALGYMLTGREDYARRATLLIRTWFLDPKTLMHTNMEFAQGVPGKSNGRAEGVLEARGFTEVADAVGMLRGSSSWTPDDQKSIEAWFRDYYHWLTTSPIAIEEAAARNNHGSWYDAQAVGIALFLGNTIEARALLDDAKLKRIAKQIEPDGKQPLEIARTKSFSYSIFNLTALMQLADYGDRVGIDLWHYSAPNGGSIQVPLDYLLPFALGEKKWPYETITGFDADDLRIPLLRAALHLHDPKYLAANEHLGASDSVEALLLKSQLH